MDFEIENTLIKGFKLLIGSPSKIFGNILIPSYKETELILKSKKMFFKKKTGFNLLKGFPNNKNYLIFFKRGEGGAFSIRGKGLLR